MLKICSGREHQSGTEEDEIEAEIEVDPKDASQDEGLGEQPSLDPDMAGLVLSTLSRSSSTLFGLIETGKGPAQVGLAENLFFSARRAFATDKNFFISREQADHALQQIKPTGLLNDARGSVCAANLVALLRLFTSIRHKDIALRPVLDNLVLLFPDMFDARLDLSAEDINKILDLAFRIRACCLAGKIREHKGNDPFLLAAEVFCGEAEGTAAEARKLLLDGTNHTVVMVDNALSAQYFGEHMKVLCSYLAKGAKAQVLRGLEGEYELGTLLDDLEAWTKTVFREVSDTTSQPIVRISEVIRGKE